jgi:hypothetical protein
MMGRFWRGLRAAYREVAETPPMMTQFMSFPWLSILALRHGLIKELPHKDGDEHER